VASRVALENGQRLWTSLVESRQDDSAKKSKYKSVVGFSDADDALLPWMDTGGDIRCVGNWKERSQLSRGVDIGAAHLGVGCTVVRVGRRRMVVAAMPSFVNGMHGLHMLPTTTSRRSSECRPRGLLRALCVPDCTPVVNASSGPGEKGREKEGELIRARGERGRSATTRYFGFTWKPSRLC
jgi:hypothetical protein